MATAKRSMSSGGPEGNVVGNAAHSTTPRREDMAAETHAPRRSWPKSFDVRQVLFMQHAKKARALMFDVF